METCITQTNSLSTPWISISSVSPADCHRSTGLTDIPIGYTEVSFATSQMVSISLAPLATTRLVPIASGWSNAPSGYEECESPAGSGISFRPT
ncbi:unnamed protein product [Protopolystoma xenopodis]|uniref:Uncharacterized protein n=1 Tax=Protopolystoma xenopodis TaxID=117903 RepID=A0A448WUF8_9PLAT|nr:unnamed protein product [Protopolystoma xenopodis]